MARGERRRRSGRFGMPRRRGGPSLAGRQDGRRKRWLGSQSKQALFRHPMGSGANRGCCGSPVPGGGRRATMARRADRSCDGWPCQVNGPTVHRNKMESRGSDRLIRQGVRAARARRRRAVWHFADPAGRLAGHSPAEARQALRPLLRERLVFTPKADDRGRYYEVTGVRTVTPVPAGVVDTKGVVSRRDYPLGPRLSWRATPRSWRRD